MIAQEINLHLLCPDVGQAVVSFELHSFQSDNARFEHQN